MNKNYPLTDIQSKINSAQKVLVCLPSNPNFDQVSAALALYVSLGEAGKNLTVVCPTPMTVEFNRLVGVDKIINKIKGTDLVISLNYSADQIEKVSYNDDGGRPSVVIQPKTGAPQLGENLVSYSYSGAGGGLVITCGLRSLSQLNKPDQDLLASSEIINLDINQANENYGLINIVDSGSSSVSEIVLGIILGLSLPFSQDVSQNVLSGIWQSTNGLSRPNANADTYEAVAICLRSGAQRPTDNPGLRQDNFKPRPKFEPKEEPKEERKLEQTPPAPQTPPTPQKPPADWFEPKIFKGSSIA